MKQRDRQGHTHGARGQSPAWTALQLLIALALVASCIDANASPFSWGFILSPSATLRVAGLAPRVKVEHPTV